MSEQKIDLKSMTIPEIEAYLAQLGEPKFRAKQIFVWLNKGVTSFDEMTNLSKSLREKLAEQCTLTALQVERKQVSKLDGTIKYLWRLEDDNCVETVLMRYKHGNTVCVSSEIGCAMGCAFCASTIGGLVRRLTAAEILSQVIFTQKDSGLPISNIVLMGIGEPLDNFDNVMRFLELVNHPDGMNIGMRHISLSTCGLTEKIDKLADLQLQLTLSVSLHAPDDETRSQIMPVNRAVGVKKLIASCRSYFEKTGRRISYEYAMIDGVNDSDAQADLLASLLKGMPSHVNLIPLNDVRESKLKPSKRVAAFQKRLESHGITATVRRKLGGDIDASCGQLRRKTLHLDDA
jgi:23S rRNA (adenine2503-C2)-methyltransferase